MEFKLCVFASAEHFNDITKVYKRNTWTVFRVASSSLHTRPIARSTTCRRVGLYWPNTHAHALLYTGTARLAAFAPVSPPAPPQKFYKGMVYINSSN